MKTRSNPFLRITGAFILGILACSSISFAGFLVPVALFATVAFYFGARKHASLALEYCFTGSMLLAFAGFGAMAGQIALTRPENAVEQQVGQVLTLEVSALEDARTTRYGSKALVACKGRFAGKLLAYFPEGMPKVEQGQELQLVAKVRPLNDSLRGYSNWLRNQGVFATASCRKMAVTGQSDNWWTAVQGLKRYLQGQIHACMPDTRMAGLATAMLLGDRSGLDREMRADFSKAGLSHVLAISGLHVGIVFALLNYLLAFLAVTPWGARLRTFLVLGLLVLYMILTGASPAVCRAVLMLSMLQIGKACFLQHHSMNLLAASAFILLLLNPLLVFQPGFQLSYAAVSGILLLGPRLRGQLELAFPFSKGRVAAAISVCLCAQAFTAPLVWFHFQQFPTFFLVSNLVLLPLVSLSVILGFAGLMTAWLPGFGQVLFGMLDFTLAVISTVSNWIGNMPFAVVEQVSFHSTSFLLLVVMGITGASLLFWREILNKVKAQNRLSFPRLGELRTASLNWRQVSGAVNTALLIVAKIIIG